MWYHGYHVMSVTWSLSPVIHVPQAQYARHIGQEPPDRDGGPDPPDPDLGDGS